jgi:EmrB/QacA subfamily drug resistance transporter
VREPPLISESPGADEVPAVAWPLLFRARLKQRVHAHDKYPWLVLIAVLVGLFASGFDITIFAVSLRDVANDLGTTPSALTWVVTGPLLATALTMPLFGKLGDLWGHRRVYLYGLAAFVVGTALTAAAWSGASLIVIRAVAAIPGAAMGPTSLALIMQVFHDDDRVKAMGWWSLVGAGAPVFGLVAGGPVVSAFGWRWIFIAQAPLSLVALAFAAFVLRETPRREREPIDLAGAATLALATLSALLALSIAADRGFTSPVVLGLAVLSPIGLALFIRCERRAAHPLLPLGFFRHRDFSASLAAQFTSQFAYMGGFIVTPLLMQERFGYAVAASGFAMVFRPLSFSASSPVFGYVAARIGVRRASLIGTVLLTLSMVLFAVAASGGIVWLVFVALVLSGLALGACSPSLMTIVANTVGSEDLGVANAAQSMVAQIGNVGGIQVLAILQAGIAGAAGFTTAYVVGAGVAFASILCAAMVRRDRVADLTLVQAEAA